MIIDAVALARAHRAGGGADRHGDVGVGVEQHARDRRLAGARGRGQDDQQSAPAAAWIVRLSAGPCPLLLRASRARQAVNGAVQHFLLEMPHRDAYCALQHYKGRPNHDRPDQDPGRGRRRRPRQARQGRCRHRRDGRHRDRQDRQARPCRDRSPRQAFGQAVGCARPAPARSALARPPRPPAAPSAPQRSPPRPFSPRGSRT